MIRTANARRNRPTVSCKWPLVSQNQRAMVRTAGLMSPAGLLRVGA